MSDPTTRLSRIHQLADPPGRAANEREPEQPRRHVHAVEPSAGDARRRGRARGGAGRSGGDSDFERRADPDRCAGGDVRPGLARRGGRARRQPAHPAGPAAEDARGGRRSGSGRARALGRHEPGCDGHGTRAAARNRGRRHSGVAGRGGQQRGRSRAALRDHAHGGPHLAAAGHTHDVWSEGRGLDRGGRASTRAPGHGHGGCARRPAWRRDRHSLEPGPCRTSRDRRLCLTSRSEGARDALA